MNKKTSVFGSAISVTSRDKDVHITQKHVGATQPPTERWPLQNVKSITKFDQA